MHNFLLHDDNLIQSIKNEIKKSTTHMNKMKEILEEITKKN